MNVLLDARTAIPRFPGIGRYAAELATALSDLFAKTGDTLTLIGNSACKLKFASNAHVTVVECDIPPEAPEGIGTIADIVKQTHPDIYHTPHRMCQPLLGMPTVLTLHDCVPVRCAFETTPQERIAYMTSVGSALKACTRAIAVSQTTLDDINILFPEDAAKCRVIPHGVAARFKPTKAAQHDAAAKDNHYKRPMLLYIGNNKRHKNLVELFRGYDRAAKLLHGVHLVLGGYGCAPLPRHTHLMQELGITDMVSWIGDITEEDIAAVIGSATAFVMPSLYEGFCLPVIEAMACGTPVACSDIPAFRETCGNTVTYFNPEDPESIAQALVTVVSDHIVRNRHRAAALERARDFKWDDVARKTLAVYQDALGKEVLGK